MTENTARPAHLRPTFQASREAVRRAHARALEVQERTQRLREAMRHTQETWRPAEAELQRFEDQTARAVREYQRFVAVVSHELRQPLNAAMGAMSLIEANASAAATERARVVLRRQLLHMSTLLDDLLDMSRVALRTIRIERTRVDLRTIVHDAVAAAEEPARTAGVRLASVLPVSEVPIVADAARLQQAFSNLLTNAIRYTPADGTVDVSLTVQETVGIVNVADTGPGIEEGDLANIFEPFWRGHDCTGDGFGIGLALVRAIVELHEGSIAAFSSGRGTGARFTITLPISAS